MDDNNNQGQGQQQPADDNGGMQAPAAGDMGGGMGDTNPTPMPEQPVSEPVAPAAEETPAAETPSADGDTTGGNAGGGM